MARAPVPLQIRAVNEAREIMFQWIGKTWCRRLHGKPMWPIHGRYICSRCLREYPVYWERRVERRTLPRAARTPALGDILSRS